MSLGRSRRERKGARRGSGGRITKDGKEPKGSSPPRSTRNRTVKYVELWGTIAAGALGAGLSSRIIDYTIPDGHAAELFAVGVMPDFLAPATSRMLDTEIGYDNKLTGIKFRTNHIGENALPYGDRLSKQPMRLLDYPLKRGNLTVKYNEGQKIQIVATMDTTGANASAVYARAKIYLLEEEDCSRYYGKSISNLATVPGGVSQALVEQLFAEYARLSAATLADGKWNDLYSRSVKDYEEITLTHLGIEGGTIINADEARIFDLRNKKEFPEFEPYWKINGAYNAMVFGDDTDEQPMYKLPSVVTDHIFTNTTMSVKITDNLAVIPINGLVAQLIGKYKRVR
ncbi:MAG: hypothetical protein HWN68_20200 [Desulfobacterales bacterium]|nr:hypothetical protein [Desulfobacterales bacterium]